MIYIDRQGLRLKYYTQGYDFILTAEVLEDPAEDLRTLREAPAAAFGGVCGLPQGQLGP